MQKFKEEILQNLETVEAVKPPVLKTDAPPLSYGNIFDVTIFLLQLLFFKYYKAFPP